nr:integrase, catalytic region, zinc finger, CCHC-type, peptidase aspartic, catalytic [Tanacetum cinerariifolium]
KFVGDFKSLAKEADESLAKHKALELEIKRLFRAVVSQDIMYVVQKSSVIDTSNLQTELERTKEYFETCIIKKENEYAKHWNDWYKKCDECKYDKISYDKVYKDMEKKIERLQAQLGDLMGKRIDNTKTRRLQPRSNTKNDRVPSASKISRSKNKDTEVEEHHRNLLLSNNTKHMSSACNNIKLDSQNVISKPKVKKPMQVGFIERLATPKPRKPRLHLRWSPTGRLVDQKGKIVDSGESESQSDCYNGNNQSIVENLLKADETHALSKPITSNSVSTPQESKGVNNDKVITPEMFRINPFKTSREEKHVPNNVSASARTKPITVSQPFSIPKKDVNSDSNGFSSTGIDNTKTRRLRPRSNTKNDRVIQICLWCVNSGCSKHITGNLKLLINFVWKFMGIVRFGNDHVAAILGFGDLQWENILITKVYFVEGLEPVPNSRQRLHLLHMDLCGPMRFASINGKWTKKIMETMNVSFDELSAMAFEQRSLKPGLQSMTSGQISSGLDLTYVPSTITTQQPSEGKLDLLFEAMYNDYIGGQSSATARTVLPAQDPQDRQTSTASTTIVDTAPTPTNLSSHAINIPITLQDVDELNPNAMSDGNTFVNPFANPSTSAAESSSSQNNQLRFDGDMCMYALTMSTMEPKNVKEAMSDPAWIDSMQEELLQFKRLDNLKPKDKENNGDMNVSFDELSVMAFDQRNSKPGLQSMTYGQISSGLDLTYAPSTITTQQPYKGELDLLFEAMYDDYIGGQPSATTRTVSAAQEPQVRQTSTTSTIIADTTPAPTNSSS